MQVIWGMRGSGAFDKSEKTAVSYHVAYALKSMARWKTGNSPFPTRRIPRIPSQKRAFNCLVPRN
eukprot:11763478-Alexandrium_andersonii.AAC.1